jgi:hypothetical protein
VAVRDIRAPGEVTGLIGPEALRKLEGDAFERYSCRRCGLPGKATGWQLLLAADATASVAAARPAASPSNGVSPVSGS